MLSSMFQTRPKQQEFHETRSLTASSHPQAALSPSISRQEIDNRRILRHENENETRSSSSDDAVVWRRNRGDDSDEEEPREEAASLLPMFDSTHLDKIPTYNMTHTIRQMVSSRCETVLTWEQLLSPQVTQFLIRPIQQEIQPNYFSAATIYCLMANCLQFTKEVDIYPGNSGTIQTRAMVCELLALKLLKEYDARGLVDALSYDFDPLQGQSEQTAVLKNDHRSSWQSTSRRYQSRSARISCLEIAIRAQAKRFLAHPVVVQHLEAIWDGSIVFHAAADGSNRRRGTLQNINYGTSGSMPPHGSEVAQNGTRKIVTLYKPREASIFKISRLRVPRYRNILSTLSYAILLGLFVAVLIQRSLHITALEVVFWLWTAGFMMDELAGFTQQGFGLYIASFWNTIDLGVFLVMVIHLCLRVYGIIMPDDRKHSIANTAYDLLAADAILLFPRLFSVLDHSRYFSQLIVAFRMMAADLLAVLVLIAITCSGFFVALTLSFGYNGNDHAPDVAYALLQMINGFTPAVWDRWPTYTVLGRSILVGFLTLCHFLILTILITVLTNSFMAVVKNANEEHQFIFAVNTISSVKSDALFSYIPPLNVLKWMLNPLQYVLPFRQYMKINRTVIKVTHFPVLLIIYIYEKTILQSAVVDSIDIVDNRRKVKSGIAKRLPRLRREQSIATLRQDQALEEVFKETFDTTLRTENIKKTKSSTVVDKWMHDMGEDDASPPEEDDPHTVAKLERKRLGQRSLSAFSRMRRPSQKTSSVASDPADLASRSFFSPETRMVSVPSTTPSHVELDAQDDTADGDDEMLTNDNEDDQMTTDTQETGTSKPVRPLDYFSHRSSPARTPFQVGSIGSGSRGRHGSLHSGRASPGMIMRRRPQNNIRNSSSATMIYNPMNASNDEQIRPRTAINSAFPSRPMTPGSKNPSSGTGGKGTPKLQTPSRLRPMFPDKTDPTFMSAPNLSGMQQAIPPNQRRSSLEMDLVSDIGDNKAIGGGYVGAIPASFVTQMAYARGSVDKVHQERTEQQELFGRLMMARMNSLEEGFRDVIHEMRESVKAGSKPRSPERPAQIRRERRAEKRQNSKGKDKEKSGSSGKDNDSGSSTLLDPKSSSMTLDPKADSTMLDPKHSDSTVVPEKIGIEISNKTVSEQLPRKIGQHD